MLINLEFNQEKINKIVSSAEIEQSDIDWSKWYDSNNFCKKIIEGVYLANLNFNHKIDMFSDLRIKDDTYSFSPESLEEMREWGSNPKSRENYGVCDNYKQVLEIYPELKNTDRRFIVSLCSMKKIDQPERNGWRWEKWGEYIGTQESDSDYLYNESNIEEIFVYHIYEMG